MIARTTLGLLALAASAAASLAGSAVAQVPSADDATFVAMAAVGNVFEVEEARLAVQRATDPRLKQFAQAMIAGHTDAMTKLQAAASKSGKPAPVALNAPHQTMLDNLKGFNGTDFDKVYLADQIASHVESVALLSDYNQNGGDAGLKAWARQSLPMVKGHLATVDAM